MRELQPSPARTLRVWTGDLPDALYVPTSHLERDHPATTSWMTDSRLAAIEIGAQVPARGIRHALLGARFEPYATNRLHIDVGITAIDGRPYVGGLAMRSDEVRVGLPADYARGVAAGTGQALGGMTEIPSGTISFRCAAHAMLGSSENMFRHTASVLIRLLLAVQEQMSDEELTHLLPARW